MVLNWVHSLLTGALRKAGRPASLKRWDGWQLLSLPLEILEERIGPSIRVSSGAGGRRLRLSSGQQVDAPSARFFLAFCPVPMTHAIDSKVAI
jgi:hypothetical protein